MILADVIDARRERIAAAWGLDSQIVLIGAGSPISKPGHADQCFEYSPHPDFYWLTGVERAGSVLAFDPSEGWTLFSPTVTQTERVWELVVEAPSARDIAELEGWVKARVGMSVAVLGDGVAVCGEGDLSYELGAKFLDERRLKDQHEVSLMKRAAKATAVGHKAGFDELRQGVTERQIQTAIESGFFDGGADGLGYHTIVGIGPNSAVFHFTPGARTAQEGDFVLFDAGAAFSHYVADVTRTHITGGKMAGWQADVYQTVNRAVNAAIELCKPGTKWVDVHLAAARVITSGLREMGVLKCSEDEAIETGAIALFFPHGVGHAVGLGVRDSGGPWPRREKGSEIAGVKIRVDFALQAGHTMTVEPGLYFIPALLEDPANLEKHASRVDFSRAEQFIGQGGVRLEDNVLITATGCENLTAMIPR